MFLDADGMIAKDGTKIGGFISVFLERAPTGGADRCAKVKQVRLLRQYDILHLCQQLYLLCMAQSQLSNACWTLQSVAGDRVTLDHLLAADSDLLDNDA